MKIKLNLFQVRVVCAFALGLGSSFNLTSAAENSEDNTTAKSTAAIPWSQIGAKAGAGYRGDGLTVIPTAEGARLRCVFQRLEGEATREGLWLTSTVTNTLKDRFRLTAVAVGRAESFGVRRQSEATPPLFDDEQFEKPQTTLESGVALRRVAYGAERLRFPPQSKRLPASGNISIDGQAVRFIRPALVEEYSVSMDGVRQDFVVLQRPAGAGELAVRLVVSGAKVEPVAGGAQLVLKNSGRRIAYSRLHVTDATGRELTVRMEVASGILPDVEGGHPAARKERPQISRLTTFSTYLDVSEFPSAGPEARALRQAGMPAATALDVVVNDSDAVYPVRIDPTFSDANWMSMNPGIPGTDWLVRAAVVDGSGALYIGGDFTAVGDVIANRVAKWNGSSWSALGSGMGGYSPYVLALVVSGSDLYAGGSFTTAGGNAVTNIAKWNGSSWSALGSGIDGGVSALAVSGNDLYAGGWFTTAGRIVANIAKWNGNSWSALGSGMDGGCCPRVSVLAVSGGDLYAGGEFWTAGGVAATNIAKWNGSSWSALGSAIRYGAGPGKVYALAVSGSDLYAGGWGWFTTADGFAADSIAKWNGSSWSALGSGMDGGVFALAVSGNDLYAASGNRIAKWNGSTWSALGSGMSDSVWTLAVSGSELYAGGLFTTAGGIAANYIAKWNGSSWSALGSGMSGEVRALAVSGSDLYAGGDFTTVSGGRASCIAKWDGSSWSALGSGISAPAGLPYYGGGVYALAVSGSDLYAGGWFTTAGGGAANSIAKWNGSSWSALGSGMMGGGYPRVYALSVSGSVLYAGGSFTTAGDIPAPNIAQWDGSSWWPLDSGTDGEVSALAAAGNDLYAGGWFTTAGGIIVNRVAKWNGSAWSALGSGIGGDIPKVYALAVSGSDLYAGGGFETAGGTPASSIAKWNGSSWSALGSGMAGAYSEVYALAVSGSNLYGGGEFTTAGGNPANRIAKWNGSSWSALGSGMNDSVRALAVSGRDLSAGGDFTTAGGKVSPYIARAYLPTLPTLSVFRSGPDVMVSWPSADTTGFALEQAGALTAPASWVTNSGSVTDDGANKSVTLPATNSRQFFRLRRP